MFNSKQYEWADLMLYIGGKEVTGIRGVKYSEKQEKEAIYAKGSQPHSIQRGNIAYEGEVTLLQSEYETLRAAGNGSILGLSVSMTVSYGDNDSTGSVVLTDELQFCEFTEAPKELKQGDKMMEITLPFIFLRLVKVN